MPSAANNLSVIISMVPPEAFHSFVTTGVAGGSMLQILVEFKLPE